MMKGKMMSYKTLSKTDIQKSHSSLMLSGVAKLVTKTTHGKTFVNVNTSCNIHFISQKFISNIFEIEGIENLFRKMEINKEDKEILIMMFHIVNSSHSESHTGSIQIKTTKEIELERFISIISKLSNYLKLVGIKNNIVSLIGTYKNARFQNVSDVFKD